MFMFGINGGDPLIGPGIANFDFMVFKNNDIHRISEPFNIQFRAEMFSVFNRANFLPPIDNQTLFSSNGALASSQPGALDSTGGFE
jgi:hypothetical protein